MEAALVGVLVNKLGGMGMERINEEASLVLNFRKEFEWLKKKLTYLSSCLVQADVQGAHDENVKNWLLEVADIAQDAEDILDECSVQYPGTADDESPQSSCLSAFNFFQLGFRHKMAGRIKELKDRMISIVEKGKELQLFRDLAPSEQPSTSTLQNLNFRAGTSLIGFGAKPVAIEAKVDEVLHLLDDPSVPVIAVVGMGGVGKTFLVQNVLDRAKDSFEMSIWLSISQTYSLRKLQVDMAAQILLQVQQDLQIESKAKMVKNDQITEMLANEFIQECLTSRKSIIVLDDVWRAAEEDDLISKLGIPMGNNSQCKIVVTSRRRDVGTRFHARVYEVHRLSEEESWKLFCAFAFPDCPQNQPPNYLEGIAPQVERKCARLPLAVRIVAASLAGERSSTEWESKLEQLGAVSDMNEPIMQILKLSYDSLPAHLKLFFAYLSFFPEDQEIHAHDLINLWVAEGFVPQGEDQLDIGWSYICHLQSLCLLERVGDNYDQYDKRFKVHDLLLDLAISISKESQCVFSAKEALKKNPTVQGSSSYRRILMAKKSIDDADVKRLASNRAYSASRLRTLSFAQNQGIQKNIPAKLLSSATVLRVLDLSGTHISSLPDCVRNLKLLRWLDLSETNISEVPECVKNIKSLLFLNISGCPNLDPSSWGIGELNCLQHLDIRRSGRNSRFPGFMPVEISKLVSLQVLITDMDNRLAIHEGGYFKLEHFVHLVNLRQVRIDIHSLGQLESIAGGILDTLVKMRTLTIRNAVFGECEGKLSLSENMLAMKDLEYLELDSFAVPNRICDFSNLKQLTLWGCHCVEYPALETMPNLKKLKLNDNNICKALPKGFGKPGGFPQLRYFQIFSFRVLEELPDLENGAMPHLEVLSVRHCSELKKVPAGLEVLKSLKQCVFSRTGVGHMFKEGGELWNNIKANNPYVRIES